MVKLRTLFPKDNNLKQNAELKHLRSLEQQGVSLNPRQQKLLLKDRDDSRKKRKSKKRSDKNFDKSHEKLKLEV